MSDITLSDITFPCPACGGLGEFDFDRGTGWGEPPPGDTRPFGSYPCDVCSGDKSVSLSQILDMGAADLDQADIAMSDLLEMIAAARSAACRKS